MVHSCRIYPAVSFIIHFLAQVLMGISSWVISAILKYKTLGQNMWTI